MHIGNTFVAIFMVAIACAGIGSAAAESYDRQQFEECLDTGSDAWDSQDFDTPEECDRFESGF